jgi:hypothetical protein
MVKINANRIIRYLLVSDFIFYSGWGLILPAFAVYVTDNIEGGNIMAVGIAEAVYLIVSSILRLICGVFLDSQPNEKSDYLFMVIGLFLASLVPFGYMIAGNIGQIYLLEAVRGAGLAMSTSGWSAIFTRHIDKGRESTEWGISAMSVGIGAGVAGILGGWAITQFGFPTVFTAVGAAGIFGAAVLLAIRNDFEKFAGHGLYFSFKELTQRSNDQQL